jgi:hypothetical protein
MWEKKLRIPVIFTVAVICGSSFAADYHSPRAAALGGAGHASPLLTDAIYQNPAMMAFLPSYSISASLNKFGGPDDAEPNGRVLHASVLDGTNPAFQAGVGYTRKTYGREVNVATSAKVLPQYSAGAGLKFLFGSDSKQSAHDASISAIGQPLSWIQSGFNIENLVEGSQGKAWGHYREFTLGVKANIQKLLFLYFDPHLVPNKPGSQYGYQAGAEIPIMADFFLRAGMNRNSFQPHLGIYGKGFGFGFGWILPRLSIDFAIEKSTSPVKSNGMLFSLTII